MAMIKDDKVYRNLQEQVLKNKIDIENILNSQQVLGEFGIKIVGYVETVGQLPEAESYAGKYGDAYAVGTATPYQYYVWTRPTSAITQAHWFYIGVFPQPGPTGATGATGETAGTCFEIFGYLVNIVLHTLISSSFSIGFAR